MNLNINLKMENSNLNLRLTKLEEFCLSLSAHLEGERVLRKEEDEKLKELCDMIAKQLIEMKDIHIQQNESSPQIPQMFSEIKDQMLNIIDSKIEEKLIDNKNRLEEEKQENYFDSKIDEFNLYRAELDKRIDILENENNKKINDIYSKIEEMDIFQNNLKIFNNEVGKKIDYLNEIINRIDEDKNIDDNRIKNIENKIKNISLNYKEKEDKNDIELNNINNNLNFLKNDFTNISEKFIKEIEEIKNKLEKYNNIKNQEIANFEDHILGEYENFTKFITNVLNQELDKIKSMNEFLSSDFEIIKNKNQYIEETLPKLREDLYDSLKKNYKYVLDKMNSYFNIQVNNNRSCDLDNEYKEYEDKILEKI